jgi:hypothetical protein
MGSDAAQSVIGICDDALARHSNNCSGLVNEVASKCGIFLSGQANDIVDLITSPAAGWQQLESGSAAAEAAASGLFVVGGLKAKSNGHVVVVVRGPLKDGKYPYAYWGMYRGIRSFDGTVINVGFTRGHGCISWAWNSTDRNKVQYAAIAPLSTILRANVPENYYQRGLIQF